MDYRNSKEVDLDMLNEEECNEIAEKVREKEETIAKYRDKAETLKKQSLFLESIAEWKKLKEMIPDNEYVIQQLAFAYYKSEYPNRTMALQDALRTINELNPEHSLDLETLGITGTIYKRLYQLHNNYDYLEMAIQMYHKGYMINEDYYNGENYANCLLFKTQDTKLEEDEIVYLRYESKKTYRKIVKMLQELVLKEDEDYWVYATLSTSYKVLGDEQKYKKYRELFINKAHANWEIETYQDNVDKIEKCLN